MDAFVQIVFVELADTRTDVFTKDVSIEAYNKHKDYFTLRKQVLIDCNIEEMLVLEELYRLSLLGNPILNNMELGK